jgi:hypothetical protein
MRRSIRILACRCGWSKRLRRVLWAYNEAHLQALHDYAAAPLRERAGVTNGPMFSRLPQWMKLGRNRVLLQRAGAVAASVAAGSAGRWPATGL